MTDARILGHMVVRNELDRYLEATVSWLASLVDDLHIHDDRSDDGTYEYLRDRGLSVSQRSSAPTWAEHEGMFRARGWYQMNRALTPREGDWILCLDADELLLGTQPCDTRAVLAEEVAFAVARDISAITFDVGETYRFEGATPMIRVDGYWQHITACRLVAWRPEGVFAVGRQGGGSVPRDWINFDYTSPTLALLHLGYARPEDRTAKYQRYFGTAGHNARHIESILTQPSLTPWTGQPLPVEVDVASR